MSGVESLSRRVWKDDPKALPAAIAHEGNPLGHAVANDRGTGVLVVERERVRSET